MLFWAIQRAQNGFCFVTYKEDIVTSRIQLARCFMYKLAGTSVKTEISNETQNTWRIRSKHIINIGEIFGDDFSNIGKVDGKKKNEQILFLGKRYLTFQGIKTYNKVV